MHLGVEIVGARCVYTGRQLWEREFTGIGHPFTTERGGIVKVSPRIPDMFGASFIGSPVVTLVDVVYVRHEGKIHRLDPATGKTEKEIVLPGRSVKEIYGEEAMDWGHISVQDEFLITTSVPQISEESKTDALGRPGSHSAASSSILTVIDRQDGEVLWEHEARIGFRHNSIVSCSEKVYVIDGLPEQALEQLTITGKETETQSKVLALDMETGEVLWEADCKATGTFMLYSCDHDILVRGGRTIHNVTRKGRRQEHIQAKEVVARRGIDGEILWEIDHWSSQARRSNPLMPAAVWNDMLIPGHATGTALSILTGEKNSRNIRLQENAGIGSTMYGGAAVRIPPVNTC